MDYPWSAYAAAVLRLETPDGVMRVKPASAGQTRSEHPAPLGQTICAITAHNPQGRRSPARRTPRPKGDLRVDWSGGTGLGGQRPEAIRLGSTWRRARLWSESETLRSLHWGRSSARTRSSCSRRQADRSSVARGEVNCPRVAPPTTCDVFDPANVTVVPRGQELGQVAGAKWGAITQEGTAAPSMVEDSI
jgi:hypothetical protein